MCPNELSAKQDAGSLPAVQNNAVVGSAKTVMGVAIPDTVDGTVEFVKQIDLLAEKTTSACWWAVGELLLHLPTLGVEDPIKLVTARTRYKERTLRYARSVRLAFGYDQVARLTGLGLSWTSLRDLAGDALEPHREHLANLFETGRMTDLEIREQAAILRKHGKALEIGAGEAHEADADAANGGELNRVASKVASQATRLQKDIIDAREGFRDKLANELVADDGSLHPKAEAKTVAMNRALQSLVMEAVELLARTSSLLIADDYPFQELEDRLVKLRADFDAASAPDDVSEGQPA